VLAGALRAGGVEMNRIVIPLVLAVLLFGFALGFVSVSTAFADDPTPVATPAPSGGGGGISLPDPKQWAGGVFNQVLVNLLNGFANALRGVVNGARGSALNFITQTPPAGSYASPTVQAVWGIVRTIANAALALVTLWGGFNLIAREQLGSPYHAAME